MINYFQNFQNSFKDKRIAKNFLVDLVFVTITSLLLVFYNSLSQAKAAFLGGVTSQEALAASLFQASQQDIELFTSNLYSLFFVVIVGLLILIIFTWLFYSLTRAYIWNDLTGKKLTKKNYWKWNILHLVIILPLIFVLLILGLIKSFIMFLLSSWQNTFIYNLIDGLLLLLLLLAIVQFVFMIYYSFTQKYKVWESIGDAFNLISQKWTSIWKGFLYISAVGVIVSIVSGLVQRALLFRPQWQMMIVLFVILFAFLAWMRSYVASLLTLKH